jgi:4-amino-4-deoxy-L-arabinose transferase-like glycosyltransferase
MTSLSSNTKINRYFWFITVSIVFILTLPTLIQDGMFMDGELYTAVSHNLANGIGTFWFPSFSYHNLAGIKDSFHEQPPLVFGIQALFFKILCFYHHHFKHLSY